MVKSFSDPTSKAAVSFNDEKTKVLETLRYHNWLENGL